MANVFLSYDHEDLALAKPLASALEKAGHTVWYDRHIHGGAQYSRKIEQALDDAHAVIVLWTSHSLESAWVRDEAAEGRDRGKLVPLSVGGITAPMGFRQFQTIDLGDWKGRGKVPRLEDVLEAIASQSGPKQGGEEAAVAPDSGRVSISGSAATNGFRRTMLAVLALSVVVAAGIGFWVWRGSNGLPIIEVASANASPRSQAAASDLFVKLGSLAEVGGGKWQLVDAASAPSKPDLVFRTADIGSVTSPAANLVLLDGTKGSLLWSREFAFPAGAEADLRQQMSLTAGRVLGCALESRDAGGLRQDLLKLFLNACATLSESSSLSPGNVIGPLRLILDANPAFAPAWARLLYADTTVLDFAGFGQGSRAEAIRALRADIEKARNVAPELPELSLAEVKLLPPTAYGRTLNLLNTAAEKAPNKAEIFADLSFAFQKVGRMSDAVVAARRAAELDPLSPVLTTQSIMTLAYAGQVDNAREELSRAEKLWAGTGALRDAQFAFHLRYGDPALARRLAVLRDVGLDFYLAARADPSAANVEKLRQFIRGLKPRNAGVFGGTIQPLGEFNLMQDLWARIDQTSTQDIAQYSYLLFRPSLAGLRRDPAFMRLASRIGLLQYWKSSDQWPDFCNESHFPYNCKAEAAKYG